jgi:hypothetical protein
VQTRSIPHPAVTRNTILILGQTGNMGGVDQPRPILSSGSHWWWKGTQWIDLRLPSLSSSSFRIPSWLRAVFLEFGLWLVAISAAPVAAISMADGEEKAQRLAQSAIRVVIVLAIVGVLATVTFGALVALHHAWTVIPIASIFGTMVLVFWYVIAFVALEPSNPQADNQAGAGVAILGIPTFAAIAMLLVVGAAPVCISRLIRWQRSNR